MPVVGDRVQVPSKRVGQAPRDGVVTGVSGGLLRVTWSSGEESTIFPSMGSLLVVGKMKPRTGAKKARSTQKAAAKKSVKRAAPAPARNTAKTSSQKSAVSSTKTTKKPGKPPRAGAEKPTSKGSGRAGKRRK